MSEVLLQGGRVLDPATGRDEVADVSVRDGKIVDAVGSAATVINCDGMLVAPGLIDMRAHCEGPGAEDASVKDLAQLAVHGGFTTVLCMPDTDPCIDTPAQVEFVRRESEIAEAADVYPACALTKNRDGEQLTELGKLVAEGALAFCDEQRTTDSSAMLFRAMRYASMFDRPVIEYSQDPELSSGAMNAGGESTLAGLPSIPSVAEEMALARACMLARDTGCRYHAPLLTARNSVRAIKRAKKLGVNVTSETCVHYLVFNDANVRREYDSRFKFFPPLRTDEDIAWLKRGLRAGIIDCISSGHQPVAPQDEQVEFGRAKFGAVGLETTFAAVWTHLVATEELSALAALATMTSNPAKILGLSDRKGSLTIGHDADVVVFDPNADWTVDDTTLVGAFKNTPFFGQTLRGRVRHTLARGRVFSFTG